MKSVFSVMVPALLLMSVSAYAADPSLQPSGGKADPAISAGTNGLQGSVTGQGYMNGPAGNGSAGNGASTSSSVAANNNSSSMSGDTASMSATAQTSAQMSADTSPTYAGGRKDYRKKSEASLNASEAQITAQLNQQASVR